MNRFMRRGLLPSLALAAGISFGAATAEAALVAHWSLDANASDTTGSHNGGVVGSTVTFGQPGARFYSQQSASFTGTGHIDVPYSPALNPSSFTATAWLLPTVAGGGAYRSPLTSRDDVGGGVTTHGYIIYNDNTGQWSFWTGDGDPGWDTLGGGAVATNQWTHVAISFDAGTSTKSIYINGALANTTTTQQLSPNGPQLENLHIGAGSDPGTAFNWEGRIDDVAVFNTALSAAAVQKVYATGVSNFNAGITPVVITPTAVTSSTAGTDLYPAVNLINGSGLSTTPTIENIHTVTHAGSGPSNAWVTTAFFPEYYTSGAPPVLTFDLGGDYNLTDVAFWNYSVPGNAAKDFTIEFSYDGSPFFNPVLGMVPQAAGPAHLFDLGGTFRADMVRLTFTDNYFGQGAGGDRVGLNEIRFIGTIVVPEPATAGLALIAVAVLCRRRRAA